MMSTTPPQEPASSGSAVHAEPHAEEPADIDVRKYVVRTVLAVGIAYVATRATAALLGEPDVRWAWVPVEAGIAIALVAGAILVACAIPIRGEIDTLLGNTVRNASELRERNAAQRFLRDVSNAFEMADDEIELRDAAALALHEAGPGDAEILVADASNAHLQRVAVATGRTEPGCSVTTPRNCPAVRQGHSLKFGNPNGMAACPRLRERHLPDDAVATCIPINILGTPSAVLHAISTDDLGAEGLATGARALEGVAVRFGQRIGMMRAMSQSQLQADTDPLTGLYNRRAMENRVRNLQLAGTPYAVAMADLDHFKQLNDTYGHDTGDRALRLFSRVLTGAVRDHDIVCRYGGEEFVLILVGADVVSAAPIVHRVRERLHEALADAGLPSFTTSLGLADSSTADSLRDVIQFADTALLEAKAEGRDRLVISDDLAPGPIVGTPE